MTEVVKIGQHVVDLSKALPLTLRDMKNLQKRGLNIMKMTEMDGDQLIAYVVYIVGKANHEVTEDDVLDSPLELLTHIAALSQEEPDKDFLASSTSSHENTAGPNGTSKS